MNGHERLSKGHLFYLDAIENFRNKQNASLVAIIMLNTNNLKSKYPTSEVNCQEVLCIRTIRNL